jgi:hypothetical protein
MSIANLCSRIESLSKQVTEIVSSHLTQRRNSKGKVENVVEKEQKTGIQGDRYAGIQECLIWG